MESLICLYCLNDFGDDQNPPLTLICNHTLCKNCVEFMICFHNCVICPQCKPVPRNKNSEILQVIADYREIKDFLINQEILDLAKKKSRCLCSVHSSQAVGLDLKTLNFYCNAEEHSSIQMEKDFKNIDFKVYKKISDEIYKFKKNIYWNSESSGFTELKGTLEANLKKMREKFGMCKKFLADNGEIFKTLDKVKYFRKFSDKSKLSIRDKVKFLEMKKNMETMKLENFPEDFKNSIQTFSIIIETGELERSK